MSSILTITFSPCIDKSTSITALIPEKKLRCGPPLLEPGGGGINVARAIRKLGGNAVAVFPSGGYTGKHFNYLMEQEGIDTVIINTENETRENIIVFDESKSVQYRFGMPGTKLSDTEWQACLDAVIAAVDVKFIVASGSLPPGVPDDIYGRLATISERKNAKLIVDTSGVALSEAVDKGIYMIKPNIGELASLAGKESITVKDVIPIAKDIITNKKVEVIVVSMGKLGAVLVTSDQQLHVRAPDLSIKSTVGAGDSMVAGIIYSLTCNNDLATALKYGVAAGCAATLNPGSALCNKKDVESLLQNIH